MPRRSEVSRQKRGRSAAGDAKATQGGPRQEKAGLRFVIQKHDARRLHYDLRLELGGVLKSWAVTRGPSLDPTERRLAVRIEDRRLDRELAEAIALVKGGVKGGSASSMFWDCGRWHPRGNPQAALKRGVLEFDLDGARMKGGFSLIRLGAASYASAAENWLLVKERDGYAEHGGDVSGRWQNSMIAIEAGRDRITRATRSSG